MCLQVVWVCVQIGQLGCKACVCASVEHPKHEIKAPLKMLSASVRRLHTTRGAPCSFGQLSRETLNICKHLERLNLMPSSEDRRNILFLVSCSYFALCSRWHQYTEYIFLLCILTISAVFTLSFNKLFYFINFHQFFLISEPRAGFRITSYRFEKGILDGMKPILIIRH